MMTSRSSLSMGSPFTMASTFASSLCCVVTFLVTSTFVNISLRWLCCRDQSRSHLNKVCILSCGISTGVDAEGPWFMPDILVNVRKIADESVGVIREVLPDGSCKVHWNGETITVALSEIETVVPRKSDKIKIMGGVLRGATGKLIGVDGTDRIVKVDDTLDVKILDMVLLAKLAHS